jgi:hypothetical protein
MKDAKHLKRIISAWLIAVLVLTSGGMASFAAAGDDAAAAFPETAAEEQGGSTDSGSEAAGRTDGTESAEDKAADDERQSGTAESSGDADGSENGESSGSGETTGSGPDVPQIMESFRITENTDARISFAWDPVDTAAYYVIYLDGREFRIDDTEDCTYTFTGLEGIHGFRIEAMSSDGERLTGSESFRVMTFSEDVRRAMSSRTLGARNLGINLRKMLGEGTGGYAVSQGGCTDGTYGYYLMVSSSNQKGRILKTRLSDNKVVKTSGVLNIHHGNGMAYDSKRKQLVVVARESRKQELTVIDANSLTVKRQENVRYNNYRGAVSGSLSSVHQTRGLAAIAYSERYDVYLALEREFHNILIFDPDTFEAKGIIFTTITAKYPGTYQAMDADDRYVYLLLSYYNKSQPYNMVLALDWNSENLLDVINDPSKSYAEKGWYCGNRGDGIPDAAIRINTPYEAENIYHINGADGRAHFYISEYYNNPQYKTVRQKVSYKVKWKKVKKKVKWKRVKRRGKWKWKYKKVKVWKYKTKYKYVNKTVLSHYNRDNYVYDLGSF